MFNSFTKIIYRHALGTTFSLYLYRFSYVFSDHLSHVIVAMCLIVYHALFVLISDDWCSIYLCLLACTVALDACIVTGRRC